MTVFVFYYAWDISIVDHALVRKWILLTAPEDKMAGAKVRFKIFWTSDFLKWNFHITDTSGTNIAMLLSTVERRPLYGDWFL